MHDFNSQIRIPLRVRTVFVRKGNQICAWLEPEAPFLSQALESYGIEAPKEGKLPRKKEKEEAEFPGESYRERMRGRDRKRRGEARKMVESHALYRVTTLYDFPKIST